MIGLTKKSIFSLAMVILLLGFVACTGLEEVVEPVKVPEVEGTEVEIIDENGYYTSPEDVAFYLHIYGKLPDNYITKQDANDLGWDAQKGNLWEVTDKMSIGGNKFENREKLLPESDSRQYYEADVNYEGGYRGAERLVYSDDGLIFYTEDHYESFEQLYGED